MVFRNWRVVLRNWEWYSETGELYSETGELYSRKLASCSRKLASCIRKLASCSRKLAVGNWNPGIRQLGPRRRKHAKLILYEDRLKRISLSIYCLEVVAALIPSYNKLKLRCPSNPINVYLGGGGRFDPS